MKRIRDIFRCPRSFRLHSFRPRCLCVEDDVTRCQSAEEVYQHSGYSDAGVKPEPKAPSEPSEASFQFILPRQCDEVKTPEELNVPEEAELKLQVETLLDTPEATSVSDLSKSEEELHITVEPEVITEMDALPDPPEAASLGDFPEPEQELLASTESELQLEDEALLDTSEASSAFDLSESVEELHFLNVLDVNSESEAPSNLSESSSAFGLSGSDEELCFLNVSDVESESEAPFNLSESSSAFGLSGSEEELCFLNVSDVKSESEAPSDLSEASSAFDLSGSEEELCFLNVSDVKSESEAPSDLSEASSAFDLSGSEEELCFLNVSDVKTETEAPSNLSRASSAFDLSGFDELYVRTESEVETESVSLSFLSEATSGLQDFRACAVLGQGSFGKVLLAEYKPTQDMFAVKAITKADVIEKDFTERLRYEKEILQTVSSVRHPFLINLFTSFQDEHYIFFVMEYAAGGDLLTNVPRITGSYPENRAVYYAACVVLGLECLHQNKIIHRDLKLENVVLDKEGFAKITDFGLSKAGIGFGDRTKSIVGTPVYMAPEMVTRQEYTRDIDWWSLGVLIYSMLSVEMPFIDINGDIDKLNHKIVASEVSYPQDWSPESISLISQLLVKNPVQRLGSSEKGAEDVKAHPFFRDIEWRRLLLRELRPPFLPPLSGPEDVSNFDEEFTSMAPVLTSPEGPDLTEEQQDLFRDFDWTAEWTP